MTFFSTIFCWPCAVHSYSYLPKKDDDTAKIQAEAWIRVNPVNAEYIRQLNSPEKLNAYGKKVIQGLRTFPINSSNEDLVMDYLRTICKADNCMQSYLREHVSDLRGDHNSIKRVKEAVI